MTFLLRKEIRMLLPAWIITMASAALIGFVRPDAAPVLLFFVGIGSLFLGITSFGSEFSQGTFSLLLAQPIPRNQIWWTKTITLGAALLSVAIAVSLSFVCLVLRSKGIIRADDVEMPAIFMLLFFGAAFAGGLLSALATRQMATAFWVALLFPFVICGAVGILTIDRSEKTVNISIAAALAVYDVIAFVLAYYQFQRAQDLPEASGTAISLPAWMRFGAKARLSAKAPSHRPLRALIKKEFQLHQVSVCFAAVLLVMHLIVLLIRRMIFVPGGPQKNLYELLGVWWLLWWVVPVIIASAAVAEERRQGTLEGQLCLPARRRTQWIIKCITCFFLAVLFGGVMPWLLETAAKFAGYPSPFFQNLEFADHWLFLRWTTMIAAVTTLVAFYASSLTRSLLQAIGVAVIVPCVLTGFVFQTADPDRIHNQNDLLTLNALSHVGLPALFVLLLRLSYTNFKHLTVSRRVWLENGAALLFAMVFVYGIVELFFWS